MKNLFLLLPILLFTGCSTVKKAIEATIDTIPQHEFGEFGYNRAGNVSSGSITASNARFEGDQHIIDRIDVQHANRVTGNISVYFKDLKRPAAVSATGGVK
jgi:hypothetical protein